MLSVIPHRPAIDDDSQRKSAAQGQQSVGIGAEVVWDGVCKLDHLLGWGRWMVLLGGQMDSASTAVMDAHRKSKLPGMASRPPKLTAWQEGRLCTCALPAPR